MNKKNTSVSLIIIAYFVFSFLLTVSITIDETPKNIICIMKVNDKKNGFWNTLSDGAQMAALEYGVNLEILGPDEEKNIEMQNNIIEKAIEKQPDAIILAAGDNEKTLPFAKKIKEKGIKLIIVDSGLKDNIENSYIATDNFKAGKSIGKLLDNLTSSKDQIGIVSFVESSKTAIERENGVRSVFENNQDKVVKTVYCNSNPELSKELTINMIKENPNIKAIAALNQYSTEGAARAIEELGLQGKVKLVGMDNSKEQIKYLEKGIIDGLVVQKPLNMGYLGVETAIQILNEKEVETKIDSGSLLVTRDNMYTGIYQKTLFPFMEN